MLFEQLRIETAARQVTISARFDHLNMHIMQIASCTSPDSDDPEFSFCTAVIIAVPPLVVSLLVAAPVPALGVASQRQKGRSPVAPCCRQPPSFSFISMPRQILHPYFQAQPLCSRRPYVRQQNPGIDSRRVGQALIPDCQAAMISHQASAALPSGSY